MRRATFAALALALMAASPLAAQEHPLVRDYPGSWQQTLPVKPTLPAGLTPEEQTRVTSWVNQFFEIIHKMPEMAPPSGFQAMPHAFLSLQNADHTDAQRAPVVSADLIVNLAPYERMGRGVAPNERDTAGSATIKINDLQPLMGSETELRDEQGVFIRNPPEPEESAHGFPVFAQGNGTRWIVIRRTDAPFFAPVTCGRYMQAAIRKAEGEFAAAKERRAKVPAAVPASILETIDEGIRHFQARVDNDRRAYDALSSSARAAPAFIVDPGDDDAPRCVGSDDSSGAAVVFFNPAILDARAGRAVPQVIAISIEANEELAPGLAEKLDHELDWKALAALVRQ